MHFTKIVFTLTPNITANADPCLPATPNRFTASQTQPGPHVGLWHVQRVLH